MTPQIGVREVCAALCPYRERFRSFPRKKTKGNALISRYEKDLTRHRLGCFCTHHSLGGGGVGSDTPCYLENGWT